MTIDEFLAQLAQTPRRWKVMYAHHIRLTRDGIALHCPITAVAGNNFSFRNPTPAAFALGLSRDDALNIVEAADRSICASGNRELRQRLLAACAL
jgi:hypothetical protein